MADATPSRLGQINGSGATDALFLKMFAGEVLTAYDETNVMLARTMVRTISAGKSAQFPATGKIAAYYHTPGAELVGSAVKGGERVIVIDDLLVSPVFIASIDDAMCHFDVRAEYTKQCGNVLANSMDKNVLQVSILAARASATVTGLPGGTRLAVGSDATTNANEALVKSLFKASQTLDEKDVVSNGRFCVLKPAQYYTLVLSDKTVNRDFGTKTMADRATGTVYEIAGLEIVKSNHVPSTVVSTGPTAYQGDFTNTVAVVMQGNAVGTVKLMDLAIEGEYQIQRQGTLIVAKYACGHGILRPENAVEISAASS